MEGLTVGVDTGGTFTDIVYFYKNSWHILKVPSTPKNPHRAVIEGVMGLDKKIHRLIHGTTVATNTLIERKGAKVLFVTNSGLEDIIEIGRQNREKLYDLCYRRESSLVPPELRIGVRCRIDSSGSIVEDLSEEEIASFVERVKGLDFDVVAVVFLFSFLNDVHEQRMKKIILEEFSCPVYCSSEILPEFREFERSSTVVINSYVAPKMKSYLEGLSSVFGENKLKIMQSNGGIISVERAISEPVRTILSGPAGGVIAALNFGKLLGEERLITLDMGGTSTDVSIIHKTPAMSFESKITGLPIKVPMIAIHTIGAGGGSIARIDEGNVLRVGPESAGADPGPVCYGKGDRITVTDANLFLGRLIPEFFLGGNMKLYPERVKPFMKEMAERINFDPYDFAEGIITVANSNMEKAIRAVSIEKGYDPREFSLFVFGGASPLHAAFLLTSIGAKRAIIPVNPGVISAMGMVMADCIKDYSVTVMLKNPEVSKIELYMFDLVEKAKIEMMSEGFDEDSIVIERFVDVRYEGQSYEITIPFVSNLKAEFSKAHTSLYGYSLNRDMEVVNVRVKATGITSKPLFPEIPSGKDTPSKEAFLYFKDVYLNGKWVKCKVFLRDALLAGNIIDGPAIIVEYSSTVFVPEKFVAKVDNWGNIIIEAET